MCSKHDASVLNTLDPIPHKIIQAFIIHVHSIKGVTSFDVRVVLKQKFQQMLEILMLQLSFSMGLQKILTWLIRKMSLLLLHFQNLSSTNMIILHGNNDAKHSTNKLTFEVSVFSSKSQTTSLEVTRMNRPLSLCFASTIQNVEGSTLQTVV